MANLSSSNVNAYLATRSSDASEYESIADDLESSFLGALQSRFTVSSPQQAVISVMPDAQKQSITQAFRMCADFLAGGSGRSVTVTTSGFGETPPTSFTTVAVEVKADITVTTGPTPSTAVGVSIGATYS